MRPRSANDLENFAFRAISRGDPDAARRYLEAATEEHVRHATLIEWRVIRTTAQMEGALASYFAHYPLARVRQGDAPPFREVTAGTRVLLRSIPAIAGILGVSAIVQVMNDRFMGHRGELAEIVRGIVKIVRDPLAIGGLVVLVGAALFLSRQKLGIEGDLENNDDKRDGDMPLSR